MAILAIPERLLAVAEELEGEKFLFMATEAHKNAILDYGLVKTTTTIKTTTT